MVSVVSVHWATDVKARAKIKKQNMIISKIEKQRNQKNFQEKITQNKEVMDAEKALLFSLEKIKPLKVGNVHSPFLDQSLLQVQPPFYVNKLFILSYKAIFETFISS